MIPAPDTERVRAAANYLFGTVLISKLHRSRVKDRAKTGGPGFIAHFLGTAASFSIYGTTQKATNPSAAQKESSHIMTDILLLAVVEQDPNLAAQSESV